MDILGDRLLARGGNMYARDVGLHYEVFSSVNARPRLEDLCSSGNALPKKWSKSGKAIKIQEIFMEARCGVRVCHSQSGYHPGTGPF